MGGTGVWGGSRVVSEKPATATDITTLRTEIAVLSEAVREMVGTLETQAEVLTALFQAVTAPDEGEGRLAEALMRIANGLDRQTEELTVIRASLAPADGPRTSQDGV